MYGDHMHLTLKQTYCKFFLKCRVHHRGQITGTTGHPLPGFVDQWSTPRAPRNVQDYNQQNQTFLINFDLSL